MTEIERKFRLASLPEAALAASSVPISQGYLFVDKGELRIRSKGGRCYLTAKSEGSIARDEWETEVPTWVFGFLWPHTEGRRIEKTRYTIPHGQYKLEIDDYRGSLTGLVTMECEFPNEDEAGKFSLPSWAAGAVDVTIRKEYKNKALAIRGLPDST